MEGVVAVDVGEEVAAGEEIVAGRRRGARGRGGGRINQQSTPNQTSITSRVSTLINHPQPIISSSAFISSIIISIHPRQ